MTQEHCIIYISNNVDKNNLLTQIENNLQPLKGMLFSEITLNKLIVEEVKHDSYVIQDTQKNSLQKYSEGERKKILLSYLISKKPSYIIVDNVFDNLDINSQITIADTLQSISNSTIIVQLINRKQDGLPFITKKYIFKETLIECSNFKENFDNNNPTFSINNIPESPEYVEYQNNPLIKFNNVTVSYNDRVILKNICWEINANEFWQLKGANGSGKTTLLSLISGDNPKAYGQDITLFGIKKGSGESIWDIKKKIGYYSSVVSQGFSNSNSIEKMILSGFYDSIGLYTEPTTLQLKIAQQWLLLLGLDSVKEKPFLSLNIGLQKLVLVARAMIKHPPLLILDEPTAGLDDHDTNVIAALINKFAAESKTTIIYVSHREEETINPQYCFEL